MPELRALLEADGVKLQRHARNELCSPCPWCGGTDRFIYFQDTDRYWCRQCKKEGDAIQYLRDHRKMSFQDAEAYLGLRSDRPGQRSQQNRQQGQAGSETGIRPRVVATYDYLDPDGVLRCQVQRIEPGYEGRKKSFVQRQPSKREGQWINNVKGVDLLLYRLPDIVKSPYVFMLEGEQDCDLAHELGIMATTNSGGAKKLPKQQELYGVLDVLAGKTVYIVPDNDKPGLKHAEQAAGLLYEIASEVRIIKIPDQKPKGDFTDFVDKTGRERARTELQAITKDASVWKPDSKPEKITSSTGLRDYNLTDMGNAERLIKLHGPDLRFSYEFNYWLIFDGRRWRKDDFGAVMHKAKSIPRKMYQDAARINDDSVRQSLITYALKLENHQKLTNLVNLAKSEPGVPIMANELDTRPFLLNVLNGTVDLETGRLREHDRNNLITKLIPFAYDPTAECPVWLAHLNKIMNGNEDKIHYYKKASGYSLTGDTSERMVFFQHGEGANGKSITTDTIAMILGDYAMRTPTDTLMIKRNEGIPNDIARLRGARFVYASEAEQGKRLAESQIKDMTGGEKLTARFMRGEFFEFRPEFKIWFSSNHKPIIRGTDQAIWDRIRLIPFTVRILEDERIPGPILLKKFKIEASGILAWLVKGSLTWMNEGLIPPDEVVNATKSYRDEMDIINDFIEDRCNKGAMLTAKAKDLFIEYEKWCAENGEEPIHKRTFGLKLAEKGFTQTRTHGGVRAWKGLALKL